MYMATWGMQNSRDAGTFWQFQFAKSSIASTNTARYDDDLTDNLLRQANQCIDEKQRNELFMQIWDRINELHPWVYLSHAEELNGAQKDLIGLEDLYDGKINYLGNLHYPEQKRLSF